ncbi:MAG: transcriptional regulator [Candidatus Poribacteria bacterium]|nr:transcriptional regulator [Candidatus Poribacteria bacterium]
MTMDIKPIRSEADYETALKSIDQLWDAAQGSTEADQLDVLVTLVEVYEEKHYPILPPDPIEAILHYMESQELSESDLETYLGSRTCVSEVLNRERALSLDMIRKLHKGLGIPADILVQPYAAQIDEVAD